MGKENLIKNGGIEMPELILMVGVPGSGKSTYAKSFYDETKDVYISRDEIRFKLLKEHEDYFSKEKEVFDMFVSLINSSLEIAKRYVIADATHLSYSSRMRVMSRIKNRKINVNCIVMDVPLEIALERNKQRTGRSFVPETALKNMYESLSYPEKGETIDKVIYVNEDGIITKRERLGGKL